MTAPVLRLFLDMSTPNDEPTAPIRPPEQWLGFLLMRAAWLVRTRTDTALRELGLAPHTLGFLLVLHEQPESSQTAVASRLGTDRTTTSQLVDTLVRQGLISRLADPADRRNNRLALTEEGQRCLLEASARASAVEGALTVGMSREAYEALKTHLGALLATTERHDR